MKNEKRPRNSIFTGKPRFYKILLKLERDKKINKDSIINCLKLNENDSNKLDESYTQVISKIKKSGYQLEKKDDTYFLTDKSIILFLNQTILDVYTPTYNFKKSYKWRPNKTISDLHKPTKNKSSIKTTEGLIFIINKLSQSDGILKPKEILKEFGLSTTDMTNIIDPLKKSLSIYYKSQNKEYSTKEDFYKDAKEIETDDVFDTIWENRVKHYKLKDEYKNSSKNITLAHEELIDILNEQINIDDNNIINEEIITDDIKYEIDIDRNHNISYVSRATALSERFKYASTFKLIASIFDKNIDDRYSYVEITYKNTILNAIMHRIVFVDNSYYLLCIPNMKQKEDFKKNGNIFEISVEHFDKDVRKKIYDLTINNYKNGELNDTNYIEISTIPIKYISNIKVLNNSSKILNFDNIEKNIDIFIDKYMLTNRNISRAYNNYKEIKTYDVLLLIKPEKLKYFEQNDYLKTQTKVIDNKILKNEKYKEYGIYKYTICNLDDIKNLISIWKPHLLIYDIQVKNNPNIKYKTISKESKRHLQWITDQDSLNDNKYGIIRKFIQDVLSHYSFVNKYDMTKKGKIKTRNATTQKRIERINVIEDEFINFLNTNNRTETFKNKIITDDDIIKYLKKGNKLEEFSKKIEEELKKEDVSNRHSKEHLSK